MRNLLVIGLIAAVGILLLAACKHEPTITFNNLDNCITSVSINIKQGSRSSNRVLPVAGGTASATFGDWINWDDTLQITMRILQVRPTAACERRNLVGKDFIPMTPLTVTPGQQTISLDFTKFGLAPPPEGGTVPASCRINVEVRDGSQTNTNGGVRFPDFAQLELPPQGSGNFINFARSGGSRPTKLGYTNGVYMDRGPPVNILGYGYFKKIEVHIKVDFPCVITGVARTKKTLLGHNFTAAQGSTPDPVDANRSLHVVSPQHWYITDAPGMLVGNASGANRKVFHRRYSLEISGYDTFPAITWTHKTAYDVWIGINQNGKFRAPPPSHSR